MRWRIPFESNYSHKFKKDGVIRSMLGICIVKPDTDTCCSCIEEQINHNIYLSCDECSMNQNEYHLIQLCPGFFHDYAMVERDGEISKVDIRRIHHVQLI